MVTTVSDNMSAILNSSMGNLLIMDGLQTTANSLNQSTSSGNLFTTVSAEMTSLTTENLQEEDLIQSPATVELYEKFQNISNFYVNPIICLFGLISNSLGLGVLWEEKKQQKMSIYYYLCALTLSDISFLALGLIRMVPEIMKLFDRELANYINGHAAPAITYIDMVMTFNSVGMILIMSFERLFTLARPLALKDTWFSKYPFRIIVFVVLSNIFLMLPFPINLEVVSFRQENETVYFMRFRGDAKSFMNAYMLTHLVTHNYIPVICLFVANLAIPIKYYQLTKRQLTNMNLPNSQLSNQQRKITITVLVITVMYLLLYIPLLVSITLAHAVPEYNLDGPKQKMMFFLFDIGNLFAYISAANDCMIYILASNYYRQIFMKKYCRCFGSCKYRQKTEYTEDNVNAHEDTVGKFEQTNYAYYSDE